MTTILIASYLEPEYVMQIKTTFPAITVIYRPDLMGKPRYLADHTAPVERTPEQEGEWQTLLAQADILFDFDHSHHQDLPELAPNLKWIQATSSGIGKLVERVKYAERTDWVFTTASGIHARPLAEFVVFSMLYFAKDFSYLAREKAAQQWHAYCGEELSGRTISIIGLGKIGREVAKFAKMFDMRVIASRRDLSQTVPEVDALYPITDMPALLQNADYVVLITPHTHETEGLIGEAELAMLPERAVLINIARGAVVDQVALVHALENKKIRGAALDVFAVEPLPPGDPLWTMENVLISPHSASTVGSENRKLTELFIDNIRRYLAGEPMVNVLDVERQY